MNPFRRTQRWRGLLPIALIFLALISTAHAHMAVEGGGQIASGAMHPFLVPGHVLVFLGLALLLGQRVPLDLKMPAQVIMPVSALALILTTTKLAFTIDPPVLNGIALVLGILIGVGKKLPRLAIGLLSAVAVLVIGLDSTVEGGSAAAVAKTLLGTWLSLNAAILYLTVCTSNGADKQWARTGIRIAGSWIVAISVLMLAFSLRK